MAWAITGTCSESAPGSPEMVAAMAAAHGESENTAGMVMTHTSFREKARSPRKRHARDKPPESNSQREPCRDGNETGDRLLHGTKVSFAFTRLSSASAQCTMIT